MTKPQKNFKNGKRSYFKKIVLFDGENTIKGKISTKFKINLDKVYLIENVTSYLFNNEINLNINDECIFKELSNHKISLYKAVGNYFPKNKLISEINPEDPNIIITASIVDIFDKREYNKGKFLRQINIADSSGMIGLTLWDNATKFNFKENDVIEIKNPIPDYFDNELRLNISNKSLIKKSKEQINIPIDIYPVKEISNLKVNDKNIKVKGVLNNISTYDVLKIKCPICNNSINETFDAKLYCENCERFILNPKFSLFIKGKLDNTEIVFFDSLVENLLNLNLKEIINIKDPSIIKEKIKQLENLNLEVLIDVGSYNNNLSIKVKKIFKKEVLSIKKIE